MDNKWEQSNKAYNIGDIVVFEGRRYKCIQAHTTNGDYNWNPATAQSLWAQYTRQSTSQGQLTSQDIEEFKKKFNERRQFYKIPGAALGIVQNGQAIVQEGFGKRNLESSSADVTKETIFAIGSMSKSLTALMIGTQVEAGLYNWDTQVSQISPVYKFNQYKEITVADLLGMHSGLEGALNFQYIDLGKNLFGYNARYWNEQTPIYLIENLSYLPAPKGKKGEYLYNNELFASGGYLTPLKNKKPTSQLLQEYRKLMQDKVFKPIGMTSTNITGMLSSVSDNYAISYGLDMSGGEAKIFNKGGISISDINGVAPAGQVVTNVEDMNRYLITLLKGGCNPEGSQVIKSETLQKLWDIQGKTLKDNSNKEGITGKTTYGMGWWVEKISRKSNPNEIVTVKHHGGYLPSWSCMQMLVPEQNAGMVILTNSCFGREFTMEMNQELLNLLYNSDFNKDIFIDNQKYHEGFLTKLKEAIAQKVSIAVQDENKVAEEKKKAEKIIGNYEGGWNLNYDSVDKCLVLYKQGWIARLAPSKNPGDKYVYYMVASNDHRGMHVTNKEDIYGAGKIWFTKIKDMNNIDLMMYGAKVGAIKKLPETSTKKTISEILESEYDKERFQQLKNIYYQECAKKQLRDIIELFSDDKKLLNLKQEKKDAVKKKLEEAKKELESAIGNITGSSPTEAAAAEQQTNEKISMIILDDGDTEITPVEEVTIILDDIPDNSESDTEISLETTIELMREMQRD